MAGPDPIGALSSAAINPSKFANPASAQTGATDQVTLSDMAQKMLSSVTTLQTDMQSAMQTGEQNTAMGSTAVDKSEMTSLTMITDQIHRSTEVQQQLTRFVMASSMSSSLGRNLNMFLRGQ
jgi:hypothetical protein